MVGGPALHAVPRDDRSGDGGDAAAGRDALDALLVEVAGGDGDAFARVYDAVAPRVHGLALRVVRDPAQAEEVAQEALVEVWRSAARYDASRASAMTWILTIAHRRSVDRVRSAQSSTDREVRSAAASHTRDYDEVAEQVESREEAAAVRRCLDGLTPLQRESVTLAYYGGLSYPEVSDRLGASLGTVKSRMRDGLLRLRDCLGVVIA